MFGRRKVLVVITRDSVCMGDDCNAPHEKRVMIVPSTNPVELTRAASFGYLPKVEGVGHSWSCIVNNKEIAEISSSGIKALTRFASVGDNSKIHFHYKSATY